VIFGWKPTGQRLYRLEDLRDGMSVEAIAYPRISKHKIKHGVIQFRRNSWLNGEAVIYLKDLDDAFDACLGYTDKTSFDLRHNNMDDHRIYVRNLIKRRPTMANKLLSTLRLNKDQRQLAKVGVYDENGNLTEDGKELLLNHLAAANEKELVELTKDLAKCKDKEDDKK
jgi:hypothetical protein